MLPEEEHRLHLLVRVAASAIKRHDPFDTETERIPAIFAAATSTNSAAGAQLPALLRMGAQLPAFAPAE
jgi:hypothetical protein